MAEEECTGNICLLPLSHKNRGPYFTAEIAWEFIIASFFFSIAASFHHVCEITPMQKCKFGIFCMQALIDQCCFRSCSKSDGDGIGCKVLYLLTGQSTPYSGRSNMPTSVFFSNRSVITPITCCSIT